MPVFDQFWNHAVLGRAEERALASQCKEGKQRDPNVSRVESNPGRNRDRYLGDLDPHHHLPLGEPVGQLSGVPGQKDKGNRQAHASDSLAARSQLAVPNATTDHHECQHTLDDVVIGRTKKLSGDQAHEATVLQVAYHVGSIRSWGVGRSLKLSRNCEMTVTSLSQSPFTEPICRAIISRRGIF